MNPSDRITAITEQLNRKLSPTHLALKDVSARHKGHAGAKDGKGHFELSISARVLEGQPKVWQHRMIYQALADLMQTDIHALSITVIPSSNGAEKGNVAPR